MKFPNPLKPWFLYHPAQLVRRVLRAVRPPADPIQVVQLPWNCPIEIDTRETIGRSIWTAGIYDLAVMEVLYRLAEPRLLAIDAGANIGAMTGLLASRSSEVWAFEPHPQVYQRLMANVGRFTGLPGFAPCRTFHAALSDSDGEVTLEIPEGFAANQGIARVTTGVGSSVRAIRLDTVLELREVGLIKVDVEGHELSVLRGADESLAGGRIRNIVFEDHEGPSSPMSRMLTSYHYNLFEIGWRISGPVIALPGSNIHRKYEAPSYLATRDSEGALTRCRMSGWQCLRGVGSRRQ